MSEKGHMRNVYAAAGHSVEKMSVSRFAGGRYACPAMTGVAAILLLTSCTDSAGPARIVSMQITPVSATRVVGQTIQLTATAFDDDGHAVSDATLTWSTSNPQIATVSPDGIVTMLAPGVVTITVACEGRSAVATITVIPVPVANVVVTPTILTLPVGESMQLAAELSDSLGNPLTDRVVVWTSSDNKVVIVSFDGMATAVALGSAIVTATSEGMAGTVTITVTENPCDISHAKPISLGETITAELSNDDCGGAEYPYMDIYELSLNATTDAEITLRSTGFDAVLWLFRGWLVDFDDDSGGGSDARISSRLTAGDYYIWATSFDAGETGFYTLTVRSVAPASTGKEMMSRQLEIVSPGGTTKTRR